MKKKEPSSTQVPRGPAPRLEIRAEPRQVGDRLTVAYRLTAPRRRNVYIFAGPAEYVIDWGQEPGVCLPWEERIPEVGFYLAQLGPLPGFFDNGFEIPRSLCVEAGKVHEGSFEVPGEIARTDVGPDGQGVAVSIPLPPRFSLGMTIGFSRDPLEVDPTALNPVARVLEWQEALESNSLRVERTACWRVTGADR